MEREPGRRAVRARHAIACCGGFALLLAALTGCTTSNSSNAALTSSAASGPTIAFESIDGPPIGVFNRLVDNLSSEAQARNVAIASREGAASYRVRGYLAAQIVRGRTHISWVWDVYDDDKFRALRITGEEAGARGGDPWSVADEAMLRRIARASMDRLAAFLGNPGAPVMDQDATTAVAASPDPAPRRPQRRPARSAGAPSAAERLALAANR